MFEAHASVRNTPAQLNLPSASFLSSHCRRMLIVNVPQRCPPLSAAIPMGWAVLMMVSKHRPVVQRVHALTRRLKTETGGPCVILSNDFAAPGTNAPELTFFCEASSGTGSGACSGLHRGTSRTGFLLLPQSPDRRRLGRYVHVVTEATAWCHSERIGLTQRRHADCCPRGSAITAH